jgi:hypothetical protein
MMGHLGCCLDGCARGGNTTVVQCLPCRMRPAKLSWPRQYGRRGRTRRNGGAMADDPRIHHTYGNTVYVMLLC